MVCDISREPYYLPMGPAYDRYYAAIHSYSQDIARSAKEEIEKQAGELRSFRKTMIGQSIPNHASFQFQKNSQIVR